MLYLQIESPKSSVLNFLDSNSFEVIISIFQRTEKVPDMERLLSSRQKSKHNRKETNYPVSLNSFVKENPYLSFTLITINFYTYPR